MSDASGWQVSELWGTWGLKKEKILPTVPAYTISASSAVVSKSQVAVSVALSV